MIGFIAVVALVLGAIAGAKAQARQNRVRLLRSQLSGDEQVEIVGARSASSGRIGLSTVPPLRSASLFHGHGDLFSLSAAGPRDVIAVDDDALLGGGDADPVARCATSFLDAGGDGVLSSAPGAVHATISGWGDVDGQAMKARLLSFVALVDALEARAATNPSRALASLSSSREGTSPPSGEPMAVPR